MLAEFDVMIRIAPYIRCFLAGVISTALLAVITAQYPAHAQDNSPGPNYTRQLTRLSELLGAIHHLREICDYNEGQLWRDQMIKLINAENPSPAQRARLVRSFNQGFRGYRQTYRDCTPAAKLLVTRFVREGATLSRALMRFRIEQQPEDARAPGNATASPKPAGTPGQTPKQPARRR